MILLLVALVSGPAVACGDDPVVPLQDAEVSILYVGNSLTMANDLPGMVAALLDSVGAGPVFALEHTAPGTGLPDHWVSSSALEAIRSGDYDYVVLQQGPSATEGRPYLLEYAELFGDEIRAAGSIPALYMVWPAASRSFDFDGVSDSYTTAAEIANGVLLPAGDVWRAAWERDAGLPFYGPDNFHPSQLGSYAAALTMAVVFSDQDPADFPDRFETPGGLLVDVDADRAQIIKAAVASVLEG
jgi:hypothetical protein